MKTADPWPEWCRQCIKATRQMLTASGPKRCPACHPLGQQNLTQFRACTTCRVTVYTWDHSPCENHIGIVREAS